jgi:hypothetical protein
MGLNLDMIKYQFDFVLRFMDEKNSLIYDFDFAKIMGFLLKLANRN